MDLSVVVPLLDEADSLPELEAWIRRVAETNNIKYEVIFVDDGSTDDSWKIIESFSQKYDNIRGIKFRRNYGKSAALNTAFQEVAGDVVITMDADLQDSPAEIPELMAMIQNDGFDIVSGWKKKRYDPITKTIPTKLYNAVARKLSGINLHDFNCGLKAYKKEVVKNIEVYGEMHRYIPIIAKWAGFSKITEKVVVHQARKYGVTKFGIERFIYGFLDMLTITFVGKFGKRPMHFFGLLGTLFFSLGFIILIYLSLSKLIWDVTNIASRPLFFLGIVTLIIGSQLFLAGFLGELFSRSSERRNIYQIEKDTENKIQN